MQGLMVVSFIVDEILRVGCKNDNVTRARNICQDQCGCKVGTSSRNHMQGLMVVGFIVDKNDKVTGA